MKTYAVHRIKEVNGIRQYKDGKPVLDEAEKTVRLEPETVRVLTANQNNFGKVYIEVPELKPIEPFVNENLTAELVTEPKAEPVKKIEPIKPKVKTKKRK